MKSQRQFARESLSEADQLKMWAWSLDPNVPEHVEAWLSRDRGWQHGERGFFSNTDQSEIDEKLLTSLDEDW